MTRGRAAHLLRTLWRAVTALFQRLLARDVLVLAAAIAYTTILSFFPLLVGMIVLLSRWIEQTDAQRTIVAALTPYLPPGVVGLVLGTLDAAIRARDAAGPIALVSLFWTATAAASAVRHGLNRVLGASKARSFWHRKGIEIVMVALAGTLLSLSLLTSAVIAFLEGIPALANIALLLERSRAVAAATAVGPWILSGAAFLVVYRFLPNIRVRPGSLLAGSVVATLLFQLTKGGFFWYIRALSNYPVVYSYFAGVVIFMIWVYLSALVLMVGAGIIDMMERVAGTRAAPVQRALHDEAARL
jgi:membrane protein